MPFAPPVVNLPPPPVIDAPIIPPNTIYSPTLGTQIPTIPTFDPTTIMRDINGIRLSTLNNLTPQILTPNIPNPTQLQMMTAIRDNPTLMADVRPDLAPSQRRVLIDNMIAQQQGVLTSAASPWEILKKVAGLGIDFATGGIPAAVAGGLDMLGNAFSTPDLATTSTFADQRKMPNLQFDPATSAPALDIGSKALSMMSPIGAIKTMAGVASDAMATDTWSPATPNDAYQAMLNQQMQTDTAQQFASINPQIVAAQNAMRSATQPVDVMMNQQQQYVPEQQMGNAFGGGGEQPFDPTGGENEKIKQRDQEAGSGYFGSLDLGVNPDIRLG